jgi:hypothetical protein
MARGKKHTAEQIVNLLQQVEVSVANGKSSATHLAVRPRCSSATTILDARLASTWTGLPLAQ